jgi:cytochrome c oxidase subunit II
LLVVAQEPTQFAAWLDAQRQLAREPADETLRRGQQIFLGSGCSYCHAIQGVAPPAANGAVGPDLTHVASRSTIAGAVFPNNRGNLSGWIVDPQGMKPGNKMPPTRLNGPDLLALVAYLESLK